MEIGAAWGMGLRIVGILHGLTDVELNENSRIPNAIKNNNLIGINNLDKYFGQLQKRIKNKIQ